jgi:DNA-binding PucR family transcriptional regulator
MGLFADIPILMESRRNAEYKSPLLSKLREHDREHKTDFVKTLSVYLSCNMNLKESAAVLHIHANTLAYRLNRISEIFGVDFRSMNDRVSIYLDLLIEEYEYMNEIFC